MHIDANELRRLGETQSVEFKKSLSLQREGLEALCDMINTDHGHGAVFFGVGPDGNIVGVEPGDLDKAQRTLLQRIQQGFDPPLIPEIRVLECEGKNLLCVKAQRSVLVPYHEFDGRASIRVGTSGHPLSIAEKQQLVKRRDRAQHNGSWRCDRCGAIAGQINKIVITDKGPVKTYHCRCGGEYWPA